MSVTRFRRWLAVCLLPALAGCPPQPGAIRDQPAKPPRDTHDIVDVIRRNADLLDKPIWSSSASVSARFKDDRGASHAYNLEGSLLYARPRSLRIDLRPGIGDRVMGVGSNQDEYWVWIEPEMHLMRWGKHRYSDRPCVEKIPVRPDQLASCLGFGGLPGPDEELIGPARQFGTQFDILTYLKQDASEVRLDRRYYVDRSPPYLIRVVNLYDAFGRVLVSAMLDDQRPDWDSGPALPHKLTVLWPLDDARFYLEIIRFEPRSTVSPKAFSRPTENDLPAGVREIVQIDAACESPASAPAPPSH